MSETLRELFGTPEELKPVPVPVPVPVAAPIVVETSGVTFEAHRRAILLDNALDVRHKVKALKQLANVD